MTLKRTKLSEFIENVQWTFQSPYNLGWVLSGWLRLHPLKKRWRLPCKSNKRVIELDITMECPVGCYNCNRATRLAPSKAYMTLSQIKSFVEESFSLNWKWKCICLIGGEPTMHPQLFEVLSIVKQYKDRYPSTRIELCSSGFGKIVKQSLLQLPPWVTLTNTMKTSPQNFFKTFNVAPKDLPEYQNADFSKGCVIAEYGIALNHNGYYPCGAGGTVDRVFGFNAGYKSLEKALMSSMREQFATLCPNCGHFKRTEARVVEQHTSATWHNAIEEYNKKQHL